MSQNMTDILFSIESEKEIMGESNKAPKPLLLIYKEISFLMSQALCYGYKCNNVCNRRIYDK